MADSAVEKTGQAAAAEEQKAVQKEVIGKEGRKLIIHNVPLTLFPISSRQSFISV
jgi:hypothetical protein